MAMDPPKEDTRPVENADVPIGTLDLQIGDHPISLFGATTHFGTPLEYGFSNIVIETYFPANEETKQFFANLG